ncbi:uncharacterized protein L201_000223 [Kwoniella dendrophila CBS 6074]|uniref:Major facilitator superfamily (MFS) profile domain-containing protein n=1 Tax=Kwoniella dendrophila CBS 6074 TaxID=1295534 RepID=A0AAX4JIV6_9TREE
MTTATHSECVLQDYEAHEPIEPTVATGAKMIHKEEEENRVSNAKEVQQKSHYVFKFLRKEKVLPSNRLASCMLAVLFLVMFLAGWNDASQGPLLPSLQTYYNVNHLVISTIWLANFVGFMVSGITNVFISDAFGFGIVAVLGASMQVLAYSLICWGCPFPLFVIAYALNGFGIGLQDAQVNSLTTRLENSSTKMFLMHAVCGFGATISPFVSTAFVQHVPSRVYLYFAVSEGLALATVLALVVVFRLRTDEQIVGRRQTETRIDKEGTSRQVDPNHEGGASASGGKLKQILTTPVVHYMALFLLLYVGIEVTIGGWATSFLIDERGGNDNAGYVSSGYFGGLVIGRVVLIPVTRKFGNYYSTYAYSGLMLLLSIVIWFTHSIIGNAICFSIMGIFLGPMYPIVMNAVVENLPGELQGGTIGWVASMGQAGSAIMPFMAGAISEKHGVWILQPFTVASMVAVIFSWFLVTQTSRQHTKSQGQHVEKPSISPNDERGENEVESPESINMKRMDSRKIAPFAA